MNLGAKKLPSATRHCGFVVSDLGDVGAGSEGWIHDPSLLLAMCSQLLAFAKGNKALIVGWESQTSDASPLLRIRLPAGGEQHQIKALQWMSFPKFDILALGTDQGAVLLYSSTGALLMKQTFQSGSVLHLKVRASCNRLWQHNSAEELCVVYAKAIVRVDATDLEPLLHRCLQEAKGRANRTKGEAFEDENVCSTVLRHQVWNVSRNISSNSACYDGVIAGIMAPPLLEHQSTQRYFCAITVGPDCALAAHRLSEDQSSSIITNIIMKRIMPATISTVLTLTKILWWSNASKEAEGRPPEVKPQDFGRSSLITSLKDQPRKGERIALSPTGAMAAITDSLGRILLVDTHALVVIRLLKGYRDAHCFFIEVPVDDASCTSQQILHSERRKHDFILCLAIHAPRREAVEVWKLRDGPRVLVIACSRSCRVVQPPHCFTGSENQSQNEYVPAEAFILDGDSGHLSIISPRILSSGVS